MRGRKLTIDFQAGQIDQAVGENNASYGTTSSGAVVTPTKHRYSPRMYATQYTDRPNQKIALISYYVTYDITGPEVQDFLHAATIAVVGEVPLDRLWHAVPAFPTRSELWLRLLEEYGL